MAAEFRWRLVGEPMTGEWGECILTSLEGGTRLRVEQADPRCRISGPLVREGLGRGLHPAAELTGDRLVINGINQRVVYLIGAYHPDGDWYEAEWPD